MSDDKEKGLFLQNVIQWILLQAERLSSKCEISRFPACVLRKST